MSKILDGMKDALAFARGEGQAAKIHAAMGGPYLKGPGRGIIQHKVAGGYIVWNWDACRWDSVRERVQVVG